jgi:hypothetical protein
MMQKVMKADKRMYQVRELVVSLAFVITFHKVQGGTFERVVLVLNHHHPKLARIELEAVYVGITRVRMGSDLRIWPASDDELEYLTNLKYSSRLKLWNEAYDEHGFWDGRELMELGNKRRQRGLQKLKEMDTLPSAGKHNIPEIKALLSDLGIAYGGVKKKAGFMALLDKAWEECHKDGGGQAQE